MFDLVVLGRDIVNIYRLVSNARVEVFSSQLLIGAVSCIPTELTAVKLMSLMGSKPL